MRRGVTWIVLAALAVLGLVAAVDSLRSESERVRVGAAPTTTGPDDAVRQRASGQLRQAGVSGVLTYSDEDCRLHAVSLPELEPAPAPSFQMCRPATATGGLGAVDGEVVWAGLGYGAVQVVLSGEELSRAIRAGLGIPADAEAGFRAVHAVSLDEARYVVLADSTYEPRERVLAGFEGKRALFVRPRWWVGDARAVRPSPGGSYFALLGRDPPVFTRAGIQVAAPEGVPHAHGVAWSPDESWTAFATEESVYVFPSERPEGPVVRIPLSVRDLDWTEEPQVAGTP
jgi:hypothetical protein